MSYVLIIDQFEEIVTTRLGRWPEREAVFCRLKQTMRDDPHLWVVLTLRADYVAANYPFQVLSPLRGLDIGVNYNPPYIYITGHKVVTNRSQTDHTRPLYYGSRSNFY